MSILERGEVQHSKDKSHLYLCNEEYVQLTFIVIY